MSIFDTFAARFGYQRIQLPKQIQPTVEKSDVKDSYAVNPLAVQFQQMTGQMGLRRPSQVTMQTLRKMSRSNWVDRTCITTLRDEVTAIPWDIIPIDPKKPINEKFQRQLIKLLKRPNSNRENWRTLIDKLVEDMLVLDAGVIEKVRNTGGQLIELYQVDGATIKPLFDIRGQVGDVAYQQFIGEKKEPVAEWGNDDMVYMMWNPQGAIDTFGYGMSPVESGLAVGTAFLYAEAYNMGFFQRNTIPPMIINMGKDVQPGQVELFRTFLAAEMMGQQGFHTPIVGSFGEGFNVNNLTPAPKDMEWEKYVTWQMKWKVALYRMSPQDIGFTLDQYKAEGNVQQQLSKNKAINSLKGVLKEYIDTEIIGDKGWGITAEEANIQFNWIDNSVVDPLLQAQVDQIYLNTGVFAINDVRRKQGLDPIDGGVNPTIPMATPIDGNPIGEDDPEEGIEEDTKDSPDEGVKKKLTKTLKISRPKGWKPMHTVSDVDHKMMQAVQSMLYAWYKKAVKIGAHKKKVVTKAIEFDATQDYLTNGVYVYQNGVQYPVSVLDTSAVPSLKDLYLMPSDYRLGWDFGTITAQRDITPYKAGMKLNAPELYAPKFDRRANTLAKEIQDSLFKDVSSTISRGIDAGKGYAEIAVDIQQTLGIDANDPTFPQWRAERVARTESQWAINEGMRDQYKEVGVTKMKIALSPDACGDCIAAAQAGPYNVGAEDVLPVHPNCRCSWIGDFSEWE